MKLTYKLGKHISFAIITNGKSQWMLACRNQRVLKEEAALKLKELEVTQNG